MPDSQWDVLPQSLKAHVAKLQHAGAAVLTGFSRLEELGWVPAGKSHQGNDNSQDSESLRNTADGDIDVFAKSIASLDLDKDSTVRLPAPYLPLRSQAGSTNSPKERFPAFASLHDKLGETSPPGTPGTPSSRRSSSPSAATPLSPLSPVGRWSLSSATLEMPQMASSSRQSPAISPSPSFLLPVGFPLTPLHGSGIMSPLKAGESGQEPHDQLTSSAPSTYYLAELSHLRSDSLVRLRHVARRVDVEWADMQRARLQECEVGSRRTSSSSGMDEEDGRMFELWWMEKKSLVKSLEEKCNKIVSEVHEALEREATDELIHPKSHKATDE